MLGQFIEFKCIFINYKTSNDLSDLMDYDTTLSVTEIGKKLTSKSTVKSKIYAANTWVNNFKL